MKHPNKALCLILLYLTLCLTSCDKVEANSYYEYNDSDHYYWEGYEDGRDSGYDEGYAEGYAEAQSHFYETVNYYAVHYAREHSKWHPEEAMCIIEAYENGVSYGSTTVTETEYKEAVESLYHYSQYFYYEMYD